MQFFTERFLGLALVCTVSLIWIFASYVVQYLEEHTVSPFLITFISNTLFLLFLPIVWIRRYIQKRLGRKEYAVVRENDAEEVLNSLTDRETLFLAAKIAPLWWIGQFCFNLSLDLTSVSSNTILSSTSSLFAFGLSVKFLNESFFLYKLFSLLLCFAGTALVAFSDSEGNVKDKGGEDDRRNENPLLGDVICLLAALVYASYTVLMKKQVGTTQQVDMCLLFGFMGMILSIGVSLIALLAFLFGLLSLHLTATAASVVIVKGLLDNVLSDFLWAKAVLLIGPTIATVGLSLQWPIAFIIDILFFHPTWMDHPLSILLISFGSIFILLGFIGINLSTQSIQKLSKYFKPNPITGNLSKDTNKHHSCALPSLHPNPPLS